MREVGIVGVEHLELSVLVVGHHLGVVLLLAPVNVGGLRCQPDDVGPDEDETCSNDDEEGLEGHVMLQALRVHPLHLPEGVVSLPSAGPGDVPHVNAPQSARDKHCVWKY